MSVTSTDYGNVTVLTVKEDLVGEVVDSLGVRSAQCIEQRKFELVVDLSAVGAFAAAARHHVMEGHLHNEPRPGEGPERSWITDHALEVADNVLRASLPRRSISVIEVPRAP